MSYVKYGDEWRKEVMKNKKEIIVDMLRRVAMERDSLEAAQQKDAQDGATCAHKNWTEVADQYYCYDCDSVIPAPPVI